MADLLNCLRCDVPPVLGKTCGGEVWWVACPNCEVETDDALQWNSIMAIAATVVQEQTLVAKPLDPRTVSEIPDDELLGRAVKSAHCCRRKAPRWVAVMRGFGLGSTYARQLCERFNLDPDEDVKPPK